MINNRKFDELLNNKTEYLFIKTKEEIKEYINRDNEYNIINLKLEIKKFDFFNSKEIKKVMIYFVVYNESTKEYLDYSTYSNKDKNEEIILPKNSTIVKKINQYINYDANLSFKFLVVPLIKENKEYIFYLEKYLYKSEDFNINKSEETINKVKYTFSIMFYKILPLFILILIPANIYNFLINKLGFVDSLIDITTITTSFIYLLNGTINFLIEYIIYFIIGMIIFIPTYAILSINFNFYFYLIMNKTYYLMKEFLLCKKEEQHELILDKINFKRTIKDTVPLLKLFKSPLYYFLSILIYSLGVLFFILSLFISQIIDSNKNINNVDTFISIGAYQYMEYSAFPRISKIIYKNYNNDTKIVLFMGYDKIYSYYYEIEYLNKILSIYKKEEIKEFIDRKESNVSFKDIFKVLIMGKINNSNIHFIKNDMYDIFNINELKIDLNSLLEKKEIKFKEETK